MLFDISKTNIDQLADNLFTEKQVSLSVLRLDKIHPVLSGNKLFKLHYFLQEAVQSKHKTVLSFGGPYSNHLAAMAFACRSLHLNSIGIVRGEKPGHLSPTLQQCMEDGMQLKFFTRHAYSAKENSDAIQLLYDEFGDCTIIPEGGYHPTGAAGAALIMDLIKDKKFSHICTAMGTATTLAGLIMAARHGETIIGVPVLKGKSDIRERMHYLTGKEELPKNLKLLVGYHFGGYAKKTEELIQYMNQCWQQYCLPLDFVYTAKMLFAITDSIKNDYFPPGSDILCLHTGGLQGNKSLPLPGLSY